MIRYSAPDQGDAGQDVVDVVARPDSRTDARNKPAVLLHVVAYVLWIEDDRHIEVGKEQNPDRIQEGMQRLAPAQRLAQSRKNAPK